MVTATEDYQLGAVGGAAGGSGLGSGRVRRRISQVVLYVLLVIGALIALVPMVWMLSASFMPTRRLACRSHRQLPFGASTRGLAALVTPLHQRTGPQITHGGQGTS